MQPVSAKASYLRYAYLTAFFLLMAGLFDPVVNGSDLGPTIFGVAFLFVGLGGGLLLYRAASGESGSLLSAAAGGGMLTGCLAGMYWIIGL